MHLILLVLALVCFALSALPIASLNWNRLVSVGLALFVASFIQW